MSTPGVHHRKWQLLPLTALRVVRRNERLRVAIILLVSLIVLFAPYCFAGASLLSASHDASSLFIGGADSNQTFPQFWKVQDPNGSNALSEPDAALERVQLLNEHELPLWDPDSAMGTPELAAMQPESFSPFQIPMVIAPGRVVDAFVVIGRLFCAGFFAFLFFRLFLPHLGALAGGVAFMLNGYFLLFSTQPYLSVDVLLPAYLFAFEHLLRTRRWTAVAWPALVCAFAFFGGMPEAVLLLQTFAVAWIVFRIVSDSNIRSEWTTMLVRSVSALALGTIMAAVLLVPFFQFLRVSFDDHQAANVGVNVGAFSVYPPDLHVLTISIMPLIFGPQAPNLDLGQVPGHTGMSNFASVSTLFLALLGILTALRRPAGHGAVQAFFIAAFTVLTLKLFGSPIVNWVGNLPFYSLVVFAKYLSPSINFSIAALVAFGVSAICSERPVLCESGIAVVATLAILNGTFREALEFVTPSGETLFFYSSLCAVITIIAIIACVGMILLSKKSSRVRSPALRTCALAALVLTLGVEQSVNYFVPMYWYLDRGPIPAPDPFLAPAYVKVMQAGTVDDQRVFAAGGLLYPHWAGAFGLRDIRDVDAVTYRGYLPFIQAFLPANLKSTAAKEFVGLIGNGLKTPLFQRLLSLSSVGLIAGTDAAPDWDEQNLDPGLYRSIYHNDVNVFRYSRPLPRASIYASATVEPDQAAALQSIVGQDFDPFRSVILTVDPSDAAKLAIVRRLRAGAASEVVPARIVDYRSTSVSIDVATSKSDRMLMLNDANVPGWRASVDGSPATVFDADYLFRGVYIPAGSHRVEFWFEPSGFEVASVFALGSLVLCLTLIGYDTRRSFRRRR